MTLTKFLAARLAEDEAAARESFYEGQRWIAEEESVYRWPDDERVHLADRKADARHIARHDPARVLREVTAKRAILALHEQAVAHKNGPLLDFCYCQVDDGVVEGRWPCEEIRALAAVYSDSPDYDPAWA